MKCANFRHFWRKSGDARFLAESSPGWPAGSRRCAFCAQKGASRLRREIPAPQLKGGGKTEPDNTAAHHTRKIQVGRGAVALKNVKNAEILHISFVSRPSPDGVRLPGFFFKKSQKSGFFDILETGSFSESHARTPIRICKSTTRARKTGGLMVKRR